MFSDINDQIATVEDSENLFSFTASLAQDKLRLDNVVTEAIATAAEAISWSPSRSQVGDWIAQGLVAINGETAGKAGLKVKAGDLVEVLVPAPRVLTVLPDPSVTLEISYEDEDLLIINKPAGMVVHPGAGIYSGTLVNGLLHYLSGQLPRIGDAERPGIVHRLDKDTTGLMVVAKTEKAFHSLVSQLRPPRTITRSYLALCWALPKKMAGSVINPDNSSGSISLPIGRHPVHRIKMAVLNEGGKEADTSWEMKESFRTGVLLDVKLGTGRTHQIRVHFAAVGAALVGDLTYRAAPQTIPKSLNSLTKKFGRQALHAQKLEFDHPSSGERVMFEAPVPESLATLIEEFRNRK